MVELAAGICGTRAVHTTYGALIRFLDSKPAMKRPMAQILGNAAKISTPVLSCSFFNVVSV